MERLSNQQILDAGLADWRKLAQALHARYSIPDYIVAAAFVAAMAQIAEADGHHPDRPPEWARARAHRGDPARDRARYRA